MNERFLFFRNFKNIADNLPDDMRLKFYDALLAYVFDGVEPDDSFVSALITAIKPSLDKEEKRGGCHNPSGQNQYNKVKNGQNEVKTGQSEVKTGQSEVKSGQSMVKNNFEQVKDGQNEIKKENTPLNPQKNKNIFPPDMLNNISSPMDRKKEFQQQFEEFWKLYVPVSSTNGKMVAKGSKSEAEKKFIRILENGENYENIRKGLQKYLEFCRRNDQITCGVAVFLNQKRWADGYDSISVSAENAGGKRQEPSALLNTYAELADQYRNGKPIF